MPRNSQDNSYGRFIALENIATSYQSRSLVIGKANKVNKILNVLADPYKTIINNVFFEKKDLYWWVDFYSKTTFYRLRSKAISAFLSLYEAR